MYEHFPYDGKYISDITDRKMRHTICQSHATFRQLKVLYEEWTHQFLGRDTRELCFDAIYHPIDQHDQLAVLDVKVEIKDRLYFVVVNLVDML